MHFLRQHLSWLLLLVHALLYMLSLLIPDVLLLVPQPPSLVTTVKWTVL